MRVGPTLAEAPVVTKVTSKRQSNLRSQSLALEDGRLAGEQRRRVRYPNPNERSSTVDLPARESQQRLKNISSIEREQGFRSVIDNNKIAAREQRAVAAYMENSREVVDESMGVLLGVDVFV